jgi:hypothetical protein
MLGEIVMWLVSFSLVRLEQERVCNVRLRWSVEGEDGCRVLDMANL